MKKNEPVLQLIEQTMLFVLWVGWLVVSQPIATFISLIWMTLVTLQDVFNYMLTFHCESQSALSLLISSAAWKDNSSMDCKVGAYDGSMVGSSQSIEYIKRLMCGPAGDDILLLYGQGTFNSTLGWHTLETSLGISLDTLMGPLDCRKKSSVSKSVV